MTCYDHSYYVNGCVDCREEHGNEFIHDDCPICDVLGE